ncbi:MULTISPECIES: Cmx/CmrA family chloramphenicol efflux MFS transporter [Kocuria]|uniref:Cmx/CmrA family chloramphenicol efflux MFS transporter n=1 Tax=Kocuria TaxID=57493 RepID=UPI0008A2B45C|nr:MULTISPECIES: Cmx/CmrA family chloramphenicol efflux MFS transporter [Kocuria]OFK07107.1 chloramphenicol efflux pump [Kocuria sp. HMSC066H03]PKZ39002.1 MFS transporter [Kocuria rhizophila]
MPALLYLLALAVFAQGTSEFVVAGLLPGISHDLGVPLGQAGLLTSAFAIGMIVGAPTMAAISRRLSPRWTLTGFLAVFIVVHIVGALTDDFGVLFATRILAALANAGFLAVTLSTVSRIVAADRQARALSVILAGTTVALIAGVPAGAFIGAALGWRATLGVIAVVCLPALIAVVIATPTRPGESAPASHDQSLVRELRTLRTRPVQLAVGLAVLVNAATFCSFTYLAVIASGPAALTETQIPLLLALFGIGAFGGVMLAGKYADAHWTRVISISGPMLVAGWVLFVLTVGHPVGVWVLALVQGAVSFALGSTAITRVVASAREAPTMGGSFATAALNVGAVIGPVAGGLAVESMGVRGPLLASAVFALLAVALWTVTQITDRVKLAATRG